MEAVNTMYRWYTNAYACLAYLKDVRPQQYAPATVLMDFKKSSWFTRGWTLQELLAPQAGRIPPETGESSATKPVRPESPLS
jgi:hypothetical protein